jgi:hypothetical protein
MVSIWLRENIAFNLVRYYIMYICVIRTRKIYLTVEGNARVSTHEPHLIAQLAPDQKTDHPFPG